MMRCWCHAVIFGWLGGATSHDQTASRDVVGRWRRECERAGADCGARVEAMALRLPNARAVRNGVVLTVFTQAGALDFVDDEQGSRLHHQYHYLGWHEACVEHLLLCKTGDDAEHFIAVSNVTGAQTEHADIATLVPVGKEPAAMMPGVISNLKSLKGSS